MFVEAPCFNSTSMTSVLLWNAAQWRAVSWLRSHRLFTSAPLLNNNSVTSVLLFIAAHQSAVLPIPSTPSTGTPTSSISFTLLTSPCQAARMKRLMSLGVISRREMEITIKQFDVWGTHFTTHSNQSCNFIQTLMQVTTRLFRVNIKLTLRNN